MNIFGACSRFLRRERGLVPTLAMRRDPAKMITRLARNYGRQSHDIPNVLRILSGLPGLVID
jgi:hypothetical protein